MDYIQEVFSKVGVAGLNNIITQRQHWTRLQRIFYWSMFISLVCSAVVFVTSSYNSYLENATIFGRDRRREMKCPVEAVTLCKFEQVNMKKINEYITSAYGILTRRRKNYYQQFVIGISNFTILGLDKFERSWFDPTLPGGNYTSFGRIFQIRKEPIEGYSKDCMKQASSYNDCKMQDTKQKEFGSCVCYGCIYQENSVLQNTRKVDTSAAKVFQPCSMQDLSTMAVKQPVEAMVYFHAPFDLPNYMQPVLTIEGKNTKMTGVFYQAQFIETVATKRMESMNIHQRKCQFPFEAMLRISSYYTQTMCFMQCRIDLAIRECGCVPHIYPLTGSKKVCSSRHMVCVASLSGKYIDSFVAGTGCACEPTCSNLQIFMSPSYTATYWRPSERNFEFKLIMKYPVSTSDDTRILHDILNSEVDLLASWGGAVSFLLDMSLMTIVELIFFMSVYPVINIRAPHFCNLRQYADKLLQITAALFKRIFCRDNLFSRVLIVFLHSLTATFKEWLSVTSLHGVKHMGNQKHSIMVRIMWAVVFVVFIALSYWVSVVLVEGQAIVMYEGEIRQRRIPFRMPSFSICHYYTTLPTDDYEIYPLDILFLRKRSYHLHREHLVNYLGLFTEQSWDEIFEVSRNCTLNLMDCAINEEKFPCCEEYRYLQTEIGPCFSLNSLQAGIYPNNREKQQVNSLNKFYSKRHTELQLRFNIKSHGFDNFSIINIHPPAEVPDMQRIVYSFASNLGEGDKFLGVLEINVHREVVELPPELRGCRMHWEPFPGSLYPSYSYTACLAECRTLKMLRLCGCVHPMSPAQKHIPVCSTRDIYCIIRNLVELKMPIEWEKTNCTCPLSCDVTYLLPRGFISSYESHEQDRSFSVKIIAGHYQIHLRRIIEPVDKFVMVGGVFSLFLGASVMNIAEIIFFFTFRLFWHIKQQIQLIVSP